MNTSNLKPNLAPTHEHDFGLSANVTKVITQTLSIFREIQEAWIFGSRAMGTYRNGSDIDICLFGDSISSQVVSDIKSRLHESPIPHTVDVCAFHLLNNEDLKDHIQRQGKLFYQKQKLD